MKITVEFESMDEFEAFRTSGKKTRGKNTKDDEPTVEEVVEKQAQPQQQQPAAAVPVATPPDVQQHFAAAAPHGFPGGNSGQSPAHPLVAAILARIDGAINSGQASDAIVTWFRQQIGPDAAQATLDQIKQIYVPRMSETQLKQIAPQLGIQG